MAVGALLYAVLSRIFGITALLDGLITVRDTVRSNFLQRGLARTGD
jgi:hypothetical protein